MNTNLNMNLKTNTNLNTPTKLDRLNQITDYWTPKILIAVLASAFILSYAALLTLATQAGYHFGLAWLWPLLLDGVVIFSTMSLVKRQFAGQSTGYVWFLLILSDGLSIGLNGYAAWPNYAYMAIHAAPPLVLVLLLKAYTNDAKDDARRAVRLATLAQIEARIDDQTELMRSLEAEQAAALAHYETRITQHESRLAALKDETRQARKVAQGNGPGEGFILKNGNQGYSIDQARAARRAKADARRAEIERLLAEDPNLTNVELARRLGCSTDTIRRDLKALEPDGPEVVDVLKSALADLNQAAAQANGNGKSSHVETGGN